MVEGWRGAPEAVDSIQFVFRGRQTTGRTGLYGGVVVETSKKWGGRVQMAFWPYLKPKVYYNGRDGDYVTGTMLSNSQT